MKKYLVMGIILIVATNLAVLTSVYSNRTGEPTAQLTLTDRELSFPYNNSFRKESSGMTLSIKWRIPTQGDNEYSPYHYRRVTLTQSELLSLGFSESDFKDSYRNASKELFWALEFDGKLHDIEVEKARARYDKALNAYHAQPDDKNTRIKDKAFKDLEQEKAKRSRLFFVKASADYDALAEEFSTKKNTIIIKGLVEPYMIETGKTYGIKLMHLTTGSVVVPREYTEEFADVFGKNRNASMSQLRYKVKWGSRLDPWVDGVTLSSASEKANTSTK